MTQMFNRRGLLAGLGASLIVAPAIVRPTSLMPIKVMGDYTLTIAPYGVGQMMPWLKVWKNVSLIKAEMLRDSCFSRSEIELQANIRGGGLIRHTLRMSEYTEYFDEDPSVQYRFVRGDDGKMDAVGLRVLNGRIDHASAA